MPTEMNAAKPRRLLQLLGLTAGLTLSVLSHAVGMGGINVVSALGQPLRAEIELVAVGNADKPSLVARLASPDAYKGAGLDYPYGIKYNFEIEHRANGEPYLKLSSNRELNDPFVSLLVELSWASGKLMREYTFLLDPPGYVAAQPKPAAVEVQAPVETAEAHAVVAKPLEKSVVAEPVKPARAARSATPAAEGVVKGAITVRSGDTLNKIAAQVKPDQVSLDRMLVALYRANADQFDERNMNRIKVGKILRMPDQEEVAALSQAEAVQEIRTQSEDWHAYRQKLASAAAHSRPSGEPARVATGKIASSVADKAPVASESAKEVLRLSKGEAPGDKTGGAGRRDKRNAAAEDEIAKAKAAEEEKTRRTLLENNLKDMEKLAKLKAEAAALAATAKGEAASGVEAASAVASASEVAAASTVAAASEVVAASAVKHASHVVAAPPAAVEEPSFLDELLYSPALIGGAAAALLGLGGLGIMLNRRRQKAAESRFSADEEAAITGHLTVPTAPSPETGDFTVPQHPSDEAKPALDEVDPIAEAELFLNFGRDEQAEEVLKDALSHAPDNQQARLKLLGIYAHRQDAAAFDQVAAEVRATGDAAAVAQVEELAAQFGREAEPGQEIDIEDASSATQLTPALDEMPAPDFAAEREHPVPDIDLAETPVDIDFDVTATHPSLPATEPVDLDITSTSPTLAAPEMLDFDITADSSPITEPVSLPTEPEPEPLDAVATPLEASESMMAQQEEAATEDALLPNLEDLIFDVTAAAEPALETEPVVEHEVASDKADDAMEFTLDFPLDDIVEKPAAAAPAVNLADISLDLDDGGAQEAVASEPVKDEHWHEVATKLDLAKAYQEMGDAVGAREILDEVMVEGDAGQQQEAELLIKQLG